MPSSTKLSLPMVRFILFVVAPYTLVWVLLERTTEAVADWWEATCLIWREGEDAKLH